jgi:hypothetical protein
MLHNWGLKMTQNVTTFRNVDFLAWKLPPMLINDWMMIETGNIDAGGYQTKSFVGYGLALSSQLVLAELKQVERCAFSMQSGGIEWRFEEMDTQHHPDSLVVCSAFELSRLTASRQRNPVP